MGFYVTIVCMFIVVLIQVRFDTQAARFGSDIASVERINNDSIPTTRNTRSGTRSSSMAPQVFA